MKVVAGIVLYNPNIERLQENVAAIFNQVDRIIIVDNGSENIDEVEEIYRLNYKIDIKKNKENIGIACALNQILDYAYTNQYKWMLSLDQDSNSPCDMIISYQRYIGDNSVGIICPSIRDVNYRTENEKGLEFISNPEDVITSGSLINVEKARKIGGFDKRLFIDFVDTDFQKRMLLSGFSIIKDNRIELTHEVGHLEEHRFLWIKVLCSNHSAFRRYYMVRNRLYYRKTYEGELALIKEKIRLILGTLKILIYENESLEKLKTTIKGFKDYKKLLTNHKQNYGDDFMVVSFVLPALYGTGGIDVVYEYGKRLAQKGHKVTIYAPIIAYNMHRGNKAVDILKQIYATFKVAKSVYLKKLPYVMENQRGVKARAVSKISDKCLPDADVVIATAWCTAFDVNKLSKTKGKKVYFIQDYEVWDNFSLGKKSYQLPLKQITIAGWIKEKIIKECGGDGNKIDIINNGIDTDKFYSPKKNFNHEGPIRCLMLDHILSKKGVRYGVEAFKQAQKTIPELSLTMFGIKRSDEAPEDVDYYKDPTQKQLLKLYQDADIFIFPSIEEGWGMTPIEAMACKCAVVGTNVGCMLDIGKDGENVVLCKSKDADALASGIVKLAKNFELRQKIAENGYKTVRNLDWKIASDRFEMILNNERKRK